MESDGKKAEDEVFGLRADVDGEDGVDEGVAVRVLRGGVERAQVGDGDGGGRGEMGGGAVGKPAGDGGAGGIEWVDG